MDELSEKSKRFVDAARHLHQAPGDPAVKARLLTALGARVAQPIPWWHSAWHSATGPIVLGGGAVAVALLGGALWLRASTPPPPGATSMGSQQLPRVEVPQPSVEPLPSASVAGVVTSLRDVSDADAGAPREPREPRGASPRKGSATHDALALETELLARASRALTQRDLRGARQALQAHRERFPKPVLWEERKGLTVLADCLADPARSKAQAERFVTQHPGSVLNVRILRACTGDP